ncbi:unnamed protein product [Rotaria socialis]|nr:unnamed protein product [Rotaria socialis]CAF3335562.1 unnamed protein product [Rotaria socialis]CAF4238201.1 unnamed protein product [Rotaria socialis]CAF4434024.1 unnamed protein product [Rotaria socialis]CAF4488913.1 unnamed protein product [Rotaria socialis]
MMTPGLACFYGGLVESKNFLNQFFLSIVCMAIIPVQWCLFGYSFTFGSGNSVFGSFNNGVLRSFGLNNFYGENPDPTKALTIPSLTFVAYQCAFAIITVALISGAVVGRMKLIPYMIFVFLWSTLCYDPLARWIFSNQGWLNQMGTIDFAGGMVVHFASGISGLTVATILGPRSDFDPDALKTGQTHLPFTVLGTGMLWVGWMGFNGGSALAANGIASLAIVNTNVAAASSIVIWIILDIICGKAAGQSLGVVSIPGTCSAVVVGLVVITPAAGYVQPGYALLMGLIGGFIVYLFLLGKNRFFHVDDSLDVFTCHGVGGLIGSLLTGLFCQTDVSSKVNNGALYGNPVQLWYQVAGILITSAFSVACTAAILLPMHFTIGIRTSRDQQIRGLDNVAHGVIDCELPQQKLPVKLSALRQDRGNLNIATVATAIPK